MEPAPFSRIPSKVRGLVFDKDGTLLDFNTLWAGKIEQWIAALAAAAADQAQVDPGVLTPALENTLGFDPGKRGVVPDSPLAVAAMPRLYAVAMTVLYQHGLAWHEAESIAERLWQESSALIPPDLVRPVGDVAGTLRTLKEAGYRLAIITSDDRQSTLATLPILGIEALVEVVVCGDDPFPVKPAPEGLWHIGRHFSLSPGQLLLVGDTASDMLCGRNAGVSLCVGILGGAGDRERLAAGADLLLPSIDGLIDPAVPALPGRWRG